MKQIRQVVLEGESPTFMMLLGLHQKIEIFEKILENFGEKFGKKFMKNFWTMKNAINKIWSFRLKKSVNPSLLITSRYKTCIKVFAVLLYWFKMKNKISHWIHCFCLNDFFSGFFRVPQSYTVTSLSSSKWHLQDYFCVALKGSFFNPFAPNAPFPTP